MQITGARALITGGSEGIGHGIAAALIAKGAKVAIMARDEAKLQAAAEELGAFGIPGDVSVEEDAERAVAAVETEFGGLDILVNNAGIGYFAPLIEQDKDEFERVFAVNVTGAMLMGRAAARLFVKQNSGHLLNISSTSGLSGGKGSSAYASSKFALRGMTECWRAELRPHNVRVTLVNPSEVQTPFFAKLGHEQVLSEKKLRPNEIADAIVGALEIDDRGFIP
ncbi:MAG: SDR family oxidoreductase, partial [Gemmatimonadetes bacterium]|nr:SDR family oxidoreductase [Gemmatimonadota bacterium]